MVNIIQHGQLRRGEGAALASFRDHQAAAGSRSLRPRCDLNLLPAGDFRAGKRHGLGKAAYGDGTKYEGEWADGVRSGQGVCLYANGDKYQGGWEPEAAACFCKLFQGGLKWCAKS